MMIEHARVMKVPQRLVCERRGMSPKGTIAGREKQSRPWCS
jgi:hypothetical protein